MNKPKISYNAIKMNETLNDWKDKWKKKNKKLEIHIKDGQV